MSDPRILYAVVVTLVVFTGGASAQTASDDESLLAFPGADGYAAHTVAGRGGRVVHVTHLNRRGPGSFSWAVNEINEPRTIVFDVSGVIDCRDEMGFLITADNDQVTIAGETSPGGVAIYNYRNFVIRDGAEQVVMRFLRFRGTRIHTKNDPDALLIWHASDVIVDHCSFAGACDETVSTSDTENVTIQWSGYDESRKDRAHADFFDNGGQWHNYGGLHSRSKGVSIHHCLFAHQSKRNPLTDAVSNVEAVNNVIYNYSNEQQTWGAAGEGLAIANCVFKLGPDRRKNPIPVRDNVRSIRGCESWLSDDSKSGPEVADLGQAVEYTLRNVDPAAVAYERVLQHSGALPRDATSARMIHETKTGTGRQGYQADIDADRAALAQHALANPAKADGDSDGIPDEWEAERGLDPENGKDSSRRSPGGYTWLEVYCHERAEHWIALALDAAGSR